MKFNLRFDPSSQLLLESSAAIVAKDIYGRWENVDEFHLVLTGGSSGVGFANQLSIAIKKESSLAVEYQYDVSEKTLHIWMSDERFVEISDENRNDSAALAPFSEVECTVVTHRVNPPSESSLPDSALTYANSLRTLLGDQFFDFTILGFGDDGHLASCFPGDFGVLNSIERALSIENSPKYPPQRTTITLSQLARSRRIIIFAIGEVKREALIHTLKGDGMMPVEILSKFHKDEELMIYTDISLPDYNLTMSSGEIR